MARIRTVKPEFWTDERLTECSMSARLLFIGMLNFSDDNGNQPYSAKRIKMQVFPADSIDTQPLIDELITHALLIEYSVSDVKYLHIKGFKKHQLINRPTKSDIPQPLLSEPSVSPQVPLTTVEERRGEEGKGIEHIAIGKPNCPHAEIISLYHEILPVSPAIKDWTAARASALKARWNESPDRQNLEYWKSLFEYIAKIPFLTGRVSTAGRKPFIISLDWLVKAENFAKVREGRYEEATA